MMNSEHIRNRIEQLLQQSPLAGLSADVRLMLQSQLQSLLSSTNLISREEFEVQAEALRRTQAKLAELEGKLSQLEQQQQQQRQQQQQQQ
ncbi:MAG: accessory factor UbiK family protein [Saccharospirillaceae bacterium]|nr:accessory factor UbiK family protein [Saccharospirillaceae bacterium]MCD8530241.1 accessory factor UbiK family protein [Saccharospirillaceae bacterium]